MENTISQLLEILSFDPVLIGVFAGLAMLYVQAVKPIWRFADSNPKVLVLGLTLLFSVFIALDWNTILQILVLNYLLMIGASGLYTGAKNTEEKDNPTGI